jgi:virginiamycin B lyase
MWWVGRGALMVAQQQEEGGLMHIRCWRWRPGLLIGALAAVCALSLALASGAQAYIYWVNSATGSIGRANLDGTDVNQNFITGLAGPSVGGVAVDPGRYDYYGNLVPTDTHIYWTNGYGIGRANPDGSEVNVNFIDGLDQQPIDVAIYNRELDSPSGWPVCFQDNLVWTEAPWQGTTRTGPLISSAQLPGCMCSQGSTACSVREGWIDTLANDANAIAAGATASNYYSDYSGHVYWTALAGRSIGRANLADNTPTINENFITTATNNTTSEGVAVRQENFCTNCGYIYWVNRSIFDLGGSIGRANLDGSGVDTNFINLLTGYSADTPQAVAVDPAKYDFWKTPPLITTGAHIYWTQPNSGRIGRADLDGSGKDLGFITGAAKPWSIAVDAGGPPPPGAPQGPPNVAEEINSAGLPKGLVKSLTAKLRTTRRRRST